MFQYLIQFRPEKKENKEGDNTEKIAEQDKNESELEKDKDKVRFECNSKV